MNRYFLRNSFEKRAYKGTSLLVEIPVMKCLFVRCDEPSAMLAFSVGDARGSNADRQLNESEVKSQLQAIDFYCKKCRKSMRISYALTGDRTAPAMNGIMIWGA